MTDVFPADEFERRYFNTDFMSQPFRRRSYNLFGFLVGVRNYSAIPPLSEPRGLPADISLDLARCNFEDYGHSTSWFSLEELLKFDYDQPVEDRRYTQQMSANCWNGAATAEPGKGEMTTYREFLPEQYFTSLTVLEKLVDDPKDARIVFWFDN